MTEHWDPKVEDIDFSIAINVPLIEFPGKFLSIVLSYDVDLYEINFIVEDDEKLYEIIGGKGEITYFNWALSAETIKKIYLLSRGNSNDA